MTKQFTFFIISANSVQMKSNYYNYLILNYMNIPFDKFQMFSSIKNSSYSVSLWLISSVYGSDIAQDTICWHLKNTIYIYVTGILFDSSKTLDILNTHPNIPSTFLYIKITKWFCLILLDPVFTHFWVYSTLLPNYGQERRNTVSF